MTNIKGYFLEINTHNNNQITDYINNINNPLNIYSFIKNNFRNFFSKLKIEWIPYLQIEKLEQIAEGGFGTIYKALLNNGNTVAVKKFSDSQNISKHFLSEVIFLILLIIFIVYYTNFIIL